MSDQEVKIVNSDQLDWIWADVRGTPMQEARIMNGEYGIYSAFYRLPAGTGIKLHRHVNWVQVTVIDGAMAVTGTDGTETLVGAGGSYVVPPDGRHVERSVADTLVLVVSPDP